MDYSSKGYVSNSELPEDVDKLIRVTSENVSLLLQISTDERPYLAIAVLTAALQFQVHQIIKDDVSKFSRILELININLERVRQKVLQ